MKLIHSSDLHIGKQVCGHSMLEDQRYILDQILRIVDEENPDGLLLSGDVYDKSVPSADAVSVLDNFLVEVSRRHVDVFVLSGNHDSAERIAFGGRLMEQSGVHVSPVYDGTIRPVTLKDAIGEVDIWMLPFIRPAMVRACLDTDEEREQVTDYTSAMKMVIAKMQFTPGRRNVLLAHQYVTGAERSESEECVGGLDNVDASVFAPFDYVALGHIHKPQNVAKDDSGTVRARYSGTPLKYSLSEAKHGKSVTVLELGGVAGQSLANLDLQEIPLVPQHEVREIRGTFAELVSPEFQTAQIAAGNKLDDYVYVKLTDEYDIPDGAAKLRGIYPNLMMLEYDNERTRSQRIVMGDVAAEKKLPMELFSDFFKEMMNREMNAEESAFVQDAINGIWEVN